MLQILRNITSRSADLLGISASVLCMIHCMVFPVFISLGFIFQHGEEHDHDHWHFLDYIFIALAVWAVFTATKNTNSNGIKIGLWTAVSIFAVGVALHDWNPWMVIVSFAASVELLIIHILNWKFHKKCKIISE